MENRTVTDRTELAEVTRPSLGQKDGSKSNFPITNTRVLIDSEKADIKGTHAGTDQNEMTIDSEISLEHGLLDIEETMKYRSLVNSETSDKEVRMTKGVDNAPLTHVDEDDGLMKMLGKLCGVDKQKLVNEEYEPYIKSPYNWREGASEAIEEKIYVESGERPAFQGKETEMPVPRQPVNKKHSETHVTEISKVSYPKQTSAQTMLPPGQTVHRVVHSADSNTYNFNHSQRGYMLAIVNDVFVRQSPRDGAHWDLIKMKEIARKFGFRSLNYNYERNLTKSETLYQLNKARHTDHSDCDCFVFMISTHGLEHQNALKHGKNDHALVCADDQLIYTSTIMEMFNDTNCPTLRGKPKIFLIQACRGEKLDHGGNVLVAFPRNEDKTCGVTSEVEANRWMRESTDESDTRPGQDTWAANQHSSSASGPTSSHVTRQVHISNSSLQHVPAQNRQNPTIFTPKIQSSTPGTSHTPQYRQHIASAPVRYVNKIYAPTPYAIADTPSIQCDSDMLVMFAIPPGMFAWRNTSEGSWMIDYLHRVLMAYDMRRPKNFLNLLTKVNALMSRRATNTPSNPSMHEKTAVSVIEHKLDKDIVFQQKVPVSDWIKKSKTFAL